MRFLFLVFALVFCYAAVAQKRFTLSGYVTDAQTGETLINAAVSLSGKTKGINTNNYGFYSITLTEGTYNFICSYIGYQPQTQSIALTQNVTYNFLLQPQTALSAAVVVTTRKRESNVKAAQMGKITLPIEQIKSLPAIFGEVDILKTVQLLPGVRNSGEGSSGIYVRGGGADQNLILLDDAPVYNTGHLFGFFSIFNSDAIKNVSLIKGGMPAQYGGRLSSVLDVAMKEGNNQNTQLEGGVGLIASRFSVQGPIKKNKASYIISARRTYVDVLAKPFIPATNNFNGSGYYFYDVNTKANFIISQKDKLFVSGYFGRDVFNFKNAQRSLAFNIPWGNATGTLRWNHVFNKKMFSNTTLVYNDYNFTFNAVQNNFSLQLASGIRDFSVKEDIDIYPFSNHKIKLGGIYTYHRFKPSVVSGRQDSIVFAPINPAIKFAHEAAIYIQDDWDVSEKIKVNVGLRYSFFQQVGPFKQYKKDVLGNPIDSTLYSRGTPIKTYGGLEPRLTLRYALSDAASVKASASRNLQYIHLVSNAGTTLPTDIWVPSTLNVQPQKSWLYAVGYFKNFKNNTYETSMELYYKSMQNQIEYQEGYVPNTLEDTENFFTFGRGWSYGAEFFVNKAKGRLTGWVGYTLSYTNRRFAGLNGGNTFAAKYDRRHDLSIVASYQLNAKWKLSGNFVYGSGNAATLPQRFYIIEGQLTQEYSNINQYRLPAYHRLDVAATLTPSRNANKKIKGEWVFSIYNLYSRQNPYFIYFDQTGDLTAGTLKVQAKQVSLFPIIPSVTYNFKF
jgi:hypothetical protein